MDEKTNLAELKEIIKHFCRERDWDKYHNAKDLAIGIVTEASELIDIFRFKSNEEIGDMLKNADKRRDISDELVDVLYFVLRFAERYDIDLATEFHRKMQVNRDKYPVDKCRGINKKYTEV